MRAGAHGPGNGRDLLDGLRRLDEGGIRPGLEIGIDAIDRRLQAFAGARVGARDDREAARPARLEMRLLQAGAGAYSPENRGRWA